MKSSEKEIDLLDLFKKLLERKKFILLTSIVSALFGLLIVFTSPKEYNAKMILMPEIKQSSSKLGGLSDLAGLAGINIGSIEEGSATISPGLYQEISRSTPFLLQLMDEKYYFESLSQEMTLYTYFSEKYQTTLMEKLISTPFRIIGFVKSLFEEAPLDEIDQIESQSEILKLSKTKQDIVDALKERLYVVLDWDLGVLTINTEMQDAEVAARVAHFTQAYITNYVKEYYVARETQNLEFVSSQYEIAKKNFQNAQYSLADFRDKNLNINSARAKSTEERLLSEYNLTFKVFSGLAQQLEESKIKLNSVTPVFKVLEPAIIPIDESKPKSLLILIASIFIGFALSITWIIVANLLPVLFPDLLKKFKSN